MNKKKTFSVDFEGKTVLITGSTRGIGRGIAEKFHDLGATVIGHGSREDTTRKAIEDLGLDYITANFSKDDEVQRMIDTLNSKYSVIDVLINNAGFDLPNKAYEEYTMDEFDKIVNINIRSVFQLTKGVFPLLKKGKDPVVINVSSIHQSLPYPTQLVYCMTKAAMEMFTKIVGMEWAPYGIRVNTLAPGAILTEMNKDIIESIGVGTFSSWIGSGTIGTVEDMAHACIFLASEMSRYMTSETLYADGGLSKGLLPYGRTPAMNKMIDDLVAQDK